MFGYATLVFHIHQYVTCAGFEAEYVWVRVYSFKFINNYVFKGEVNFLECTYDMVHNYIRSFVHDMLSYTALVFHIYQYVTCAGFQVRLLNVFESEY